MNPYKLKDVFNYLTSNNQLLKRKLKLGTDDIPIPPKRDDVTTIEAINRFNKANPRVDTTNLKPLSVKHSKVKQSNVGEADEGTIQSAFDTATREAQFEGYPAPNYDKFKSRYLKKNMKADGGMLVQPSDDGSRPGYRGKKDVDKINKIKNYINNQGDKIDAFEFKKFAKEVGYKRPAGLIDNLELGFLDNVLENKTFINKVKRPSKAGFGFSKGQMTVLDKYAKLLNSQQPEKYTSVSFIELDDPERANILQRARANDFKFKAKTKFDELTDIQKQKVIEAFGLEQDAFDYDPSKQKNVKGITKFGVSRDDKRYNQIQRYVKNGFKFSPKDILPIAKQRDIIARFELPEGFEDWDFKKYKYGIPSGGSASNPAYTKRIIDFVGGKTRFPNLAADAGTPQGWMMNQFYRTYTYEKERNVPKNKLTYKPIFETINGKQKVVGFVDNTVSGNGKTYFGIKKWNDKYNGNLLDTHFDFKNVKKFVDISNKAFAEPNKVIMGLLQKGGVKPNTKIKFNDVLNFLAEKKGYKATERAIKVHHQSGVGAGGVTGEAVKDLQLLRSEVNSSIRQAETRIRNAVVNNLTPNVDDVNKLKSLGASIKVGGKIYGSGSQTAIGSFKAIENQVISEIKNFTKKDFKEFKTLVASLGGGTCSVFSGKKANLKADGGRIGLSTGTPNLDDCFKSGASVINSGKVPVDKADDFTKLLKRAGNIGRGIMKFGIIPEALYATADSLVRVGMGDTFTEAGLRATDYLLPGDQTKAAEISKVSRVFGDETGELVGRTIDYKNQLAKIQSLEDQKANFENLSGGGEFDYIGDLSGDVKNTDKQLIQAKNDLDNKFKISEAEQLFAESKQDDAYDASKATSFLSNLKRKYRDSSDNLSDVETLAAPEKTQMQLNLDMLPNFREAMKNPETRSNLNYANLPEKDIIEYFTSEGTPEAIPGFLKYQKSLKDAFSLKNLSNTFGKEQVYGTQGTFGGEPVDMTNYKPSNRFGSGSQQRPVLYPDGRGTLAGGGIAKEAGDSSGPPPESGPNPQGLLSLMKRARNY